MASFAGLHILTDGSADTAARVTQKAAGCDFFSVSSFHCPNAIVGPPLSTTSNVKVVCSVALLAVVT